MNNKVKEIGIKDCTNYFFDDIYKKSYKKC